MRVRARARALGAERLSYGPYLSLVPADVLADTAIMELLSHYNGNGAVGGIRTARAVVGIGSAVEANYNADQLKKHRKKACAAPAPPRATAPRPTAEPRPRPAPVGGPRCSSI